MDESSYKIEKKTTFEMFLHYTAKIIGFLVGVVLSPFILLGILWFMFDIIVLNKNVDLTIIMKKIVKIHHAVMEDEDEEEDEEYDENYQEEDYVTVNVEDITPKSE